MKKQKPVKDLLLYPEGLAVGALAYGRILLMGAHIDTVQSAVVLRTAVMLTLLNSTADGFVGVCTFHCVLPPFFDLVYSMARFISAIPSVKI